MNKLLELKTKYRQLLDYGPIPEKVKDALEEAFVDWCAEYARSIINKRGVLSDKLPQPHHLSEYNRGVREGYNTLKQALLSRIDQDLQLLNRDT